MPAKKTAKTATSTAGTLMMIGGAEDKLNDRALLKTLVQHAGKGRLVVASLASEEPAYQWSTYSKIFKDLGLKDVQHFAADTREDASKPGVLKILEGATAVFFTGGDQLKITTKLGGTDAYDRILEIYTKERGLIAGTSAGAAAMGQMMLMSSQAEGSEKHKVRRAFIMARGLGLITDMVIDQHFAQRARIERLLGAIAENPAVLGVGIDEDTGIVHQNECFEVVGSGAVYVADGSSITFTNASEPQHDPTLCLFNVNLHVLCARAKFNVTTREPERPPVATSKTA